MADDDFKVSSKPLIPGDAPITKGPIPVYASPNVKAMRKRSRQALGLPDEDAPVSKPPAPTRSMSKR